MAALSPLTKAELCHAIGWSKPRLDRRLESDPNFPVRKRGTQAGGWEFDLAVVLAYLGSSTAAPKRGRPPKAVSADVPPAAAKPEPPQPAEHQGEATAKQRRDFWAAAAMEDNVRRKRGELVEAEEMRIVVSNMLAHLSKDLGSLRDSLTRELGLRDDQGEKIDVVVDQLRRSMVAGLQTLLS